MPVVLSTTTDDKVFADDETRFLSVYADHSGDQSLAIVRAMVRDRETGDPQRLRVWRAAMSLIKYEDGDFQNPPKWLDYVARHLPVQNVRVRRDWGRFLSFLQAVALCRAAGSAHPVDLEFEDYCVAYLIFEPVFSSTLEGLSPEVMEVVRVVRELAHKKKRGVTLKEIAHRLGWEINVVRRYSKKAIKQKLLDYEAVTLRRNEKRLKVLSAPTGFLPSPKRVLQRNPEIGESIRYVNPFTGKTHE